MKKELYFKILSIFSIVSILLLNIAPFSINAYDKGVSVNILDHVIGYNVDYLQYNGEHYSSGYKLYSINTSNGNPVSFNLTDLDNSYSSYMVTKVTFLFDDKYLGSVNILYNGNQSRTIAINSDRAEFSLNTQLYNCSLIGGNVFSYPSSHDIWNFPIESFNVINQQFINNYPLVDYFNKSSYIFPVFELSNGQRLCEVWSNSAGQEFTFILGTQHIFDKNNYTNFFNTENCSVKQVDELYFSYNMSIRKITLVSSGKGFLRFYSKYNGSLYYMPIYLNFNNNIYVSTDFALNFGLSNPLLDSLEIIANGTQQSNNSSSQADSINQQANDTFTQEEQLVNNAENDLNNKLTNLDIQNQNNNLFGNSKFIASASWVKTQFDYLTNNNAFGYLITFSLVLGLSLVIVGKLRG